jgi:hypothetical protein
MDLDRCRRRQPTSAAFTILRPEDEAFVFVYLTLLMLLRMDRNLHICDSGSCRPFGYCLLHGQKEGKWKLRLVGTQRGSQTLGVRIKFRFVL